MAAPYYYYYDPEAPHYYYYGAAPAAPSYYYYGPPKFEGNGGYNNYWVVSQEEENADDQSSPRHYTERGQYDYSRPARLQWATENPDRLRVSLCCEGCCWKLDEELRDLEGVYDVSISGWSDAMVTVTGMAPRRRILEVARGAAKHAEFW